MKKAAKSVKRTQDYVPHLARPSAERLEAWKANQSMLDQAVAAVVARAKEEGTFGVPRTVGKGRTKNVPGVV